MPALDADATVPNLLALGDFLPNALLADDSEFCQVPESRLEGLLSRDEGVAAILRWKDQEERKRKVLVDL